MYSTLYLVRHGQTVFNTRLLIQGRCDSPLTELGRDQARAAAKWLQDRGVRFGGAFSSPAERACATTEVLWGGPYMRLTGLQERSFGDLEGTDVLALPKPMGDYPVSFGGEAQEMLESRMSSTISAIMRGEFDGADRALSACPGEVSLPLAGRSDAPIEPCVVKPMERNAVHCENALVVSHGAACKAFAHAWCEHSEVRLPSPFPNCCILIYSFDGELFRLREVADPAAHLGGAGLPI